MYVTGGIGPSERNEGFTADYDLPNEDAYQETCASAGMVFWNYRMLKLTGDARYVDIMELSLYNALAAGVSLTGDTFCYVTPLASRGDFKRDPWFGVPCCPTTIARFLPALGLITGPSLLFDSVLAAGVVGGAFAGLALAHRIPEEGFHDRRPGADPRVRREDVFLASAAARGRGEPPRFATASMIAKGEYTSRQLTAPDQLHAQHVPRPRAGTCTSTFTRVSKSGTRLMNT